FREAAESVKAHYPPLMVGRFQDGAELCPGHQPAPTQYAVLDNRALDRQHSLENLVSNQEICQVLPGSVQGEILQPFEIRKWTVGDTLLDPCRIALLFFRASRTATRLGLIVSRHQDRGRDSRRRLPPARIRTGAP